MRSIVGLLVCFSCLAGSSRADVTGLALSRIGGTSTANSNVLTTFAITFQTSSGASYFNLNSLTMNSTTVDTATFSFNSDFTASTTITSSLSSGSTLYNFTSANFGQNLSALTTYTIYIKDLNAGIYGTTDLASTTSGVAPLNFNGVTTSDHISDSKTYYNNFALEVTAVPEPGTMILTGATLAAGAVGAWWKRRRKQPS
jgi:hypothetical protein